jgi:hypothetical protein
MKAFKLFLFLFCSTSYISAQQFVVRKSDSADFFSFLKLVDGKVSKYKEGYEILNSSQVHYMTKWDAATDGSIYWTNGENIYRCDWITKKSTLIFSNLYWVLEFFIRGNFAYVVYNPDKNEGAHDNRYSRKIEFCRINLRTHLKEHLLLPPGYNVTNLSISKDEKWATFINTRIQNSNTVHYDLVLCDLVNGKSRRIDTAKTEHSSWFGDDDMTNSACWADSNTLLYYKHVNLNDNGVVMAYNIDAQSRKIWLPHFPQRDFTWFGAREGYFYCSDRHDIYRTRDGVKKEVIFKDLNNKDNILDVRILP